MKIYLHFLLAFIFIPFSSNDDQLRQHDSIADQFLAADLQATNRLPNSQSNFGMPPFVAPLTMRDFGQELSSISRSRQQSSSDDQEISAPQPKPGPISALGARNLPAPPVQDGSVQVKAYPISAAAIPDLSAQNLPAPVGSVEEQAPVQGSGRNNYPSARNLPAQTVEAIDNPGPDPMWDPQYQAKPLPYATPEPLPTYPAPPLPLQKPQRLPAYGFG